MGQLQTSNLGVLDLVPLARGSNLRPKTQVPQPCQLSKSCGPFLRGHLDTERSPLYNRETLEHLHFFFNYYYYYDCCCCYYYSFKFEFSLIPLLFSCLREHMKLDFVNYLTVYMISKSFDCGYFLFACHVDPNKSSFTWRFVSTLSNLLNINEIGSIRGELYMHKIRIICIIYNST